MLVICDIIVHLFEIRRFSGQLLSIRVDVGFGEINVGVWPSEVLLVILQDPKFCIIIRLLERKESKDDTLYEAGEVPNEIAILYRVTMEQIGHFARYFGTQYCR